MLGHYLLAALASLLVASQETSAACSNWSARYQTNLAGVCVCNATQCDTVSNTYTSLETDQVGVYATSKAGGRFAYKVVNVDSTAVSSPTYSIDVSTQYQTMIGFGGAITDAAAINVYKLSSALQQMVLDQYFSETGLQYTLGRVPIGSTDFSTSIYSYNDVVDDFEMEHFSIAVDKSSSSHKIDLIQRALNTSSRDVKLFASSWAPPAWMTTKNTTINCSLKGSPGEEYWEALALYYSKFFDAYSEEGTRLREAGLGSDDGEEPPQPEDYRRSRQKSGILDRLAPFEDADALKYISGLGVHWYRDLDFFLASAGGDFDKLLSFYQKYPDVFILATEACEGFLPSWLGTGSGVSLTDSDKSWSRAENYGHDIIEDLNNYVAGWTDWNLALDTTGGPNWAENYVDAPILVDETNGAEFYKQPMFYIMGHFSKFIPAGSKRIEFPKTKTLNSFHRCAFVTPDNRVVIQFMNRDSSAVTVSVKQTDSKTFTLSLPAHSMQTVILPASDDTKIL
ncbi:putative glycoside hydrolase family 30 protein beta-glucosidase/xylosidase [Phytophthora sojae]|uniref:Glycoside hydrolase family 30 protein beta-glucosidase/xylosidase n=1 Tax=Phytophthora sojae (strain P6497) TaxID=1094619 RepID=G4ZEC3_PHYSP|nr:putative glycoside hydrolase family 30 protein beta-glucosidase/xylosidase [Phytophthora sojae]EGZ17886.1 putative glycoside hydrolase family 30 protein beta-glucosidase/xylosidase [Phytophthora sojae]|eukprot:XP_009526944.1 putative glycoside hydrolase family 30 protein beta-glucosidase/xylosidase [Phytophthora sojae]